MTTCCQAETAVLQADRSFAAHAVHVGHHVGHHACMTGVMMGGIKAPASHAAAGHSGDVMWPADVAGSLPAADQGQCQTPGAGGVTGVWSL